jgi:hypothetical protein
MIFSLAFARAAPADLIRPADALGLPACRRW